ncbi:MAG: helix-turn-helix transcriptional regulator [Peptococcaceae bacterium]|nr:helix-turn-helix transcriptional regulator [Peptococcaceae bacterium]
MKDIIFDVDIYNTIRKNIKRYRMEKGITSAQLAEMVGLSHDYVRQIQIETGGYNFSLETFYKISVALDVPMDTLAKNDVENETKHLA